MNQEMKNFPYVQVETSNILTMIMINRGCGTFARSRT